MHNGTQRSARSAAPEQLLGPSSRVGLGLSRLAPTHAGRVRQPIRETRHQTPHASGSVGGRAATCRVVSCVMPATLKSVTMGVMQVRSFGTVLLASAVVLGSAPALACRLLSMELHQIDADLHATDTSAPGRPTVVQVDAYRRTGMTCTDASCVWNSCGDTGTVRIALAPSADDETPPGQLGYRLSLVAGAVPESMQAMLGVDLAGGRPLFLRPSFDEVATLDAVLSAVAIDAAGNESPPSEPFVVQFGGCTLTALGDQCEADLEAVAEVAEPMDGAELEDLADVGTLMQGGSCSMRPSAPSGSALLGAVAGLALVVLRRARRLA